MDERKNLFLFYKPDEEMEKEINQLRNIAKENGFQIVNHVNDANIIVSIGGDGMFLQAVRKSGFREDCLYLGISTKDILSLYCDFNLNDIDNMIASIKNDNIEVRRYPTIEVSIDNQSPFYCLNECTIRSSIVKTFVMEVFIDHTHFETFRGDGMIIATPTGSTAYNKSVRGAIVDPTLPCFQVNELASINNNMYRTLGAPFILGKDRTLTLEIVQDGNDYPIVAMDNEAMSISNIKKVEIQLSGRVIKTVKLKNNSFWEKVKRTFL